MKDYRRKYPLFSLCGLNCGLCPRYHTEGTSRCPGCGGPDFYVKHPSCAVITCSKKHDAVEFCFRCSLYPCERYSEPSKTDSFITYRHVLSDFEKAEKSGIEKYQAELGEKVSILEFLVKNYNDGRRKNFYCMAVNLLTLPDLKDIMAKIDGEIKSRDIDLKEKIKLVTALFESKAREAHIELKLRK